MGEVVMNMDFYISVVEIEILKARERHERCDHLFQI